MIVKSAPVLVGVALTVPPRLFPFAAASASSGLSPPPNRIIPHTSLLPTYTSNNSVSIKLSEIVIVSLSTP